MGLIAIDPGVHSMAIAVFNSSNHLVQAWNHNSSNHLVQAWNHNSSNHLVQAWNQERDIGVCTMSTIVERWGSPSVRLINKLQSYGLEFDTRVIGERQVVYPGARGLKTNPNDLLDLAMCAGAFYGALCVEMRATLRLVEPAEWKAQVPKDICRRRIEAMLSDDEKKVIRKGGEMHNVYDAIGIGLFATCRALRGMVKP